MINGLSGRPGAGKSYEAVVTHIIPALIKKRKLVTNIPLNIEWFCSVIGEHCRDLIVQIDGGFHNYGGKRYFSNAEHFLRYQDWRNEENQGVFFVVDECHLSMGKLVASQLPPEEKVARLQEQAELKEYLSMHRHYGHDLLLLSQNFRKVDRDIVDMIQNCYYTTKKSFLGQDDKYIVKVADGVSRNIVAVHEREYEKKYFGAYKSHTKSDGSVKEASSADIKPWWQNKFFYMAGAFAVVFILLLVKMSDQHAEEKKRKAEILAKAKVATQPVLSGKISNDVNGQQGKPVEPVSSPTQPAKIRKHPYDGLQLHLTATASDFTREGKFQKIVYVAVSRNGQMLKEITIADLAMAGYEWSLLNDCMLEVSYQDIYKDFVFCDAPTQEVQFAKVDSNNSGT